MSVTADSGALASPAGRLRPLTRLAWRHPEWWALALSAGAWALMLRPHAHHIDGPLTHWLLMTIGMMLPMVVMPMRAAAERSLWSRRHRAITGFLVGYLACWLAIGVATSMVSVRHELAGGIAFAVAGAWQLTRRKRMALTGCHRVMPLAPRGWRADRDCVLFGAHIGTRCVISCWALMLACFFSGHALLAMAGITAVCLIERYTRRPDHRLLSAGLFAAAVISFL